MIEVNAFRSKTLRSKLRKRIRTASRVRDRQIRIRTRIMPTLMLRRCRRGFTAPTEEPAAWAPRGGWRGFRAGKPRLRRWAGGPNLWCLWRKMRPRNGSRRWSLVFSSHSFRCLRVGTIWSGFGSGSTLFVGPCSWSDFESSDLFASDHVVSVSRGVLLGPGLLHRLISLIDSDGAALNLHGRSHCFALNRN